MVIFLKRALCPLVFLVLFFPALLFAKVKVVLVNDGIMPLKEVEKIEEMGTELYKKTGVGVFVAAVEELNTTRPIDIIDSIKQNYATYILLYFSIKPTAVNIFTSNDAKRLIDIDQILSPFPWRGTIRPIMSPVFSKDDKVKQ